MIYDYDMGGGIRYDSKAYEEIVHRDGGPGSGNFGHGGRKGMRGGSAPGGGKAYRVSTPDGRFVSKAAYERESGESSAKEMTKTLDKDMSEMWSEEPALYQALSDPERFEAKKNELLNDGWEIEDIEEFKGYADEIKNAAESSLSGAATLYRGERFNSLEAAQAKYYVGAEIATTQLTSYSTNKDMASAYADYYGTNAPRVVITNTATTGNFVGIRTNHTGEGADEEVIVPKDVISRVVSTKLDKANNTLHVEMENSATPKKE